MKPTEQFKKLKENNKFVRGGYDLFQSYSRSKVSRNASSISFYVFISLIPLCILLCAQLPYTGISKEELQDIFIQLTPEAIHETVILIISEAYTSRKAIFSVSAVFLLWASSKSMLAIIQSLDMVYNVKEQRKYFKTVVFAIVYTILIVMIVGALLVVYAKSYGVQKIISKAFPSKSMFETWAKHNRKLSVLLIMTILFSLIYRFAPLGKRKWICQLPGAVFASVGISVFSVCFAVYNSRGNIYQSFYGRLAATAVFLIWVYFCVCIILIGGVINKHYESRFEQGLQHILKPKKNRK